MADKTIIDRLKEMKGNVFPNPNILGVDRVNNSTFLRIQPKKVNNKDTVNTNAREKSINSEAIGQPLFFMLPDEVSIPLQHSWREQATVSGNIRQLHASFARQYGELKTVGSNIATAVPQLGSAVADVMKGNFEGAGTKTLNSFKEFEKGGTIDQGLLALKNDNPVVYESSTRRNLSIELSLAVYENTYSDVMEPIELLMELSSPTRGGNNTQVGFIYPYIFDISMVLGTTNNVTMYQISNAVITSINPTLKYPYINGYPSSADLTIQFEDLDPLYVEKLVEGRKVNVSRKRGL